MKFVALLPVRDEADIVRQCLEHLLLWADQVFVFDTGSVDDTWSIISDMATRERRIVRLGQEPVYFSETRLRAWMFHQARTHMRDGDWFVRVDADEFHHVTPPEFVRYHMRAHETIAYHQYYDFALRQSEVESWMAGRETLADRARPIADRRRWFAPSVYSEPRLCRYRESMRWPSTVSFPYNAGFVARARLPIRHYPHRDPAQLARRCKLRAIMLADKENRSNWRMPNLHHWSTDDWHQFVVKDGQPGLRFWEAGTPLPQLAQVDHIAPFPKRMMQRFAHAFLVRALDSLRDGWKSGDGLQRISPEVVALLERELME